MIVSTAPDLLKIQVIQGVKKMKLNVKAFALSSGIISGLGLFLVTWWKILFQGMTQKATFVGSVFKGYSLSTLGSFIGLVWAFVVAFVGGFLLAWLYNKISDQGSINKEQV